MPNPRVGRICLKPRSTARIDWAMRDTVEIKHVVCLLAFYLAGCTSVPRTEIFKEESFREVSVGFSELYDNYQQSFGVGSTQAELEKNSAAALGCFPREMERAAALQISTARDEARLLDRTQAAAKTFLESQPSPDSNKSFIHWVAIQVLAGEVKDSAQLKFAFALLSKSDSIRESQDKRRGADKTAIRC